MKTGGSSGTVFAWDLRWPQQPIVLSGVGTDEAPTHSLSASEVWEVQYDTFTRSSNLARASSARVLPAMICSEDGILAVIEQGMELLVHMLFIWPRSLYENFCNITVAYGYILGFLLPFLFYSGRPKMLS